MSNRENYIYVQTRTPMACLPPFLSSCETLPIAQEKHFGTCYANCLMLSQKCVLFLLIRLASRSAHAELGLRCPLMQKGPLLNVDSHFHM